MSRTRLKPEDLRDIRELAAAWGKIVARRAFGPEGPSLDVDFSALDLVGVVVDKKTKSDRTVIRADASTTSGGGR